MNIFIIDDHQIVKDGLKLIMEKDNRFKVVGEAENSKEALERISNLHPDVCLLDINLKDESGLSLIKPIREVSKQTKIVILSMHESAEFIIQSFNAGVAAFFPKGISPATLLNALTELISKDTFYLPGQKEILENTTYKSLTQREVEILQLIANGLTSKQIAEKLNLSYRTIEAHRFNIFKKLEAANIIDAVSKAQELGILPRK